MKTKIIKIAAAILAAALTSVVYAQGGTGSRPIKTPRGRTLYCHFQTQFLMCQT
jgi:hypothetical protein